MRVVNKQMDFCYVVRETIQYYLRRHQSIIDPINPKHSIDGDCVLVFDLVRGDGVQRNWENISLDYIIACIVYITKNMIKIL